MLLDSAPADVSTQAAGQQKGCRDAESAQSRHEAEEHKWECKTDSRTPYTRVFVCAEVGKK